MTLTLRTLLPTVCKWWIGELVASIPASLRNRLSSRRRRLRIWPQADCLSIGIGPDGPWEIASTTFADDPGEAARLIARWARGRGIRPAGATIHLPADRVLTPFLELPADAAANLEEVIAAEIERQTPFSPTEVYHTFQVVGSDPDLDTIRVRLGIARRDDVDAAAELASAAGIADFDVVSGPGGESSAPNASPFLVNRSRSKVSHWVTGTLAIVVVALAATAAYLPLERLRRIDRLADEYLVALKAENAKLSLAVAAIQEQQDAHLTLVERKSGIPSALALLTDLTRNTPDHSWALQVQFARGRLMVSGHSRDATGLVRALEGSEVFHDVGFTAPVTTDNRLGVDRFHISARYDDGGAP